jgi:hypothetical protein
MTQPKADPASKPVSATRRRIDELLDEALAETFPASDSTAINSSIAAIKQEHHERKDGKGSN